MKPEAQASRVPPLRLVASDICQSFGRRAVIRSLSLEVSAGEVLLIRGANGSGKSTLLRLLSGLLRPTRGETWLELRGERATREERRGLVALAAPAIQPYLHLTLAENLRFFGAARGVRAVPAVTDQLISLIGLSDRRDDLVASFSSGMLQRARLAIALAAEPLVLLLDEPSQCLDETGRELVARIVEQQRTRGLCVVATNDDADGALAGRVVELQGRASL